jgi:hypothetical protein
MPCCPATPLGRSRDIGNDLCPSRIGQIQSSVRFKKHYNITSGSDSSESKSWLDRLPVAEAKCAMNCELIEVPMDEAPIV